MTKHAVWLLVAGCVVFLAGASRASYAQSLADPDVVVVEGRAARLHVNVNPVHPTVLRFHSRITGIDRVDWPEFKVLKEPGEVLILHPKLHRDEWGKIHVMTSDYNLMLVIHGVASPEQARDVIEIQHRSELDGIEETIKTRTAALEAEHNEQLAWRDRVIEELKEQVAKLTKGQAQHSSELASMTNQETEQRMLGDMLIDRMSVAINDRDFGRDGLLVHAVAWEKIGNLYAFIYELEHRGKQPFRVAKVELFDEQKIRNHAGAAVIGQHVRNGEVMAVIQPNERIRGIVAVHEPYSLGRYVNMLISEPPGGQPPVMREKIPLWDLTLQKNKWRSECAISAGCMVLNARHDRPSTIDWASHAPLLPASAPLLVVWASISRRVSSGT